MFYNYKGFRSIVLLAMADANAKFTFIDVGCNGRISDGGVLNRSDLTVILNQSDQYFPPPKTIGDGRTLPYVIVADNAFPLLKNMMTPYPQTATEEIKLTFNRRLSRARQNSERAFGMLSNRFQVFQKPIKLREKKTEIIVQSCCVLHNFLVTNSYWYGENSQSTNNQGQEQQTSPTTAEHSENQTNRNYRGSELIRQSFAAYFFNEGKL